MSTADNTLAKILIVDDTATNVTILFNFLTSRNYETLIALDGESALKAVEYKKPDLILLDIIMPGIDGFETCRLIKAKSDCRDIPIVFMTALSDTKSKIKGFEVGAVDYVTKPLQYEEVLARVSAHIKLHQLQRDLQAKTSALQQEIYERKQVEKMLEKERASLARRVEERTHELRIINEELVDAMQLKNQFMATMSHELRTPLNPILNISEMLVDGLYGTLEPEQKKVISVIQEHGKGLRNLISDVLDYSKLGNSETQLLEQPLSITAAAEASVQRVSRAAKQKNIELHTNINVAQDVLKGDEQRLHQILGKLLDNAVKFTPEGGKVGLTIDGDIHNELLHFCVWDTGIGIDEADFERLFEPFVQLDSKLARQFNGTGLGLSLAKKITELHNGTIKIESKLNKGSRFTISLPWKKLHKTVEHDAKATSIDSSIKVLVVGDNHGDMNAMYQYLHSLGHTVLQAWNTQALLDTLQVACADVIVIDIHMLAINDSDLIQHIRDKQSCCETPIIALTTLSPTHTQTAPIQAVGASAYLNKPVRLRELAIKIEQLVAH